MSSKGVRRIKGLDVFVETYGYLINYITLSVSDSSTMRMRPRSDMLPPSFSSPWQNSYHVTSDHVTSDERHVVNGNKFSSQHFNRRMRSEIQEKVLNTTYRLHHDRQATAYSRLHIHTIRYDLPNRVIQKKFELIQIG